jgi:8-oxo-dGTP diphosphatase
LIGNRPMSIYAIGGLKRSDLAAARRHGAHGVALLSGAFSPQ